MYGYSRGHAIRGEEVVGVLEQLRSFDYRLTKSISIDKGPEFISKAPDH